MANNRWYAVQLTREDLWDNGSYSYEEAVAMLRKQGHGLIAVIDEAAGFCEDEIKYADLFDEELAPASPEEDPEDAALRAIWQEEHDAWEGRRAADAADAERARLDAEACMGPDGFDWDEYQYLCDLAY